MRHKTKEGSNITTPMRKLIRKLPGKNTKTHDSCPVHCLKHD